MNVTINRRTLAGAWFLLLAIVCIPSLGAAQVNVARPFVGGTFFGESGSLRDSWGVGGGIAAGWAISDDWGGYVELDVPTSGTTVETYGSLCPDPQKCWYPYTRTEKTSQQVSVSVLFGRHLPAVGRFRATLLLGPAARIERVTRSVESYQPSYYGVPAPNPTYYERDDYSRLYPTFVAGFDGEIGVAKHLSIVPQLRFYLTPSWEGDGLGAIVRPGISVRWRF